MTWIPHRSLRLKLVLLAAISAGVAVLLACLSFIRNDLALMHKAGVAKLEAEADLLELASRPILRSARNAAAHELLAELGDHPSINAAALYNSTGAIIAEFRREGEPPCSYGAPTQSGVGRGRKQQLEHVRPVIADGQPVGVLYLRANMDELNQQRHDYRFIVLWVVCCSMLVATALAFVLQRRISRPILDLAEAADRVTEQGDYSLRVTPPSDDVIGHLYVAFNQMLDRIEVSDRALKVAHDELEQRVASRTAELMQEIVERKRVQEDLVRAKNLAESASRSKSEFLANMSHEIRTPLNAILGFTDLLRRGVVSSESERREYLETIHRSGNHLLSVINDILDLSKIEAGQLQVEQLPCSPSQIIAEVISVLRVRAREKNLSLDYHWTGPVPESIVTDPARLRQLFLNVVGNAVKFTEQGGVQVVAQIVNGNTPKLVVDVIDTGVGIPQHKLTRIFDPFCQADSSVTRRFGGTGLGLTICRRLARALGGGISVQSDVGKGSIFTIAVDTGPIEKFRAEGSPESDLRKSSEQVEAGAPSLSLQGRRILIADDGDSNRRLIEVVLKRAGAEVFTASNGRQAVDAAAETTFDLILMDMQMPVMDGYCATSALRERGVQIPIVALTAHAMKGDREKCLAAGCTGYLTKPIELDRLASAVSDWLKPSASISAADAQSKDDHLSAAIASTLPIDDPEFREIVEEFIARFVDKLSEMHAALASSNFAELKNLAHWLKGSGGSAGFPVLSTAAARLEEALAENNAVLVRAGLAELDGLAARLQNVTA